MKILVLTVEHNFHVPILLRNLISNLDTDDRVNIFTSSKRSELNFVSALNTYGIKYCMMRFSERLKFKKLAWKERCANIPYEKRKYLNLNEIPEDKRLRISSVRDINNPSAVSTILAEDPDLILSIYFDQIISGVVINSLNCPLINLHPSLLPAYAGVAPTFHVLANDEKETGFTLHEITERLDSGAVIAQKKVAILDQDTQFSLYRRCTLKAVKPILQYCCNLKEGNFQKQINLEIQKQKSIYRVGDEKKSLIKFLRNKRRFI